MGGRVITPDIITALWSLKEDATHAWKLALEGSSEGLHAVGAAIKRFETEVARADVIATMVNDRKSGPA